MIASRYMHKSGHLCGNMYVCEYVYACVYVLKRGHLWVQGMTAVCGHKWTSFGETGSHMKNWTPHCGGSGGRQVLLGVILGRYPLTGGP